MKNKIVNIALRNDVDGMVENPTNIANVSKGNVGGFSIEVTEKEPESFSSYTYQDNEKVRDNDYDVLQTIIKENE